MGVKTYDPGAVDLVVVGIPITGYVDGTFINIGRNNPAFTDGTGSQGEGWRAKSNDKSGICTLTLLQTSATNDALSALAALDELSGDGVGALLMKDNSGRSLYAAETCWVEKLPDSEWARSISGREWIIKTDNLEVLVGGN